MIGLNLFSWKAIRLTISDGVHFCVSFCGYFSVLSLWAANPMSKSESARISRTYWLARPTHAFSRLSSHGTPRCIWAHVSIARKNLMIRVQFLSMFGLGDQTFSSGSFLYASSVSTCGVHSGSAAARSSRSCKPQKYKWNLRLYRRILT